MRRWPPATRPLRSGGGPSSRAARTASEDRPSTTPTSATAGGQPRLRRLNVGTVHCWGSNARGELGYGDTVRRGDTPGQLPVDLAPGRVYEPARSR